MTHPPHPDRRLSQARVALLDAQIQVLHSQRQLAALSHDALAAPSRADPLLTDPRPACSVAAWTDQLQQEGLVSPGELCVMHQRAQAASAALANAT